jgi:hypothetical protein
MQYRHSRLSAEAAIGVIAAALLSSCAPTTGLDGFGPPPSRPTAEQPASDATGSNAVPKNQLAAVAPSTKPSSKPSQPADAAAPSLSAFAGMSGDELKQRWGDPSLVRAESGAALWQFQRKGCVVLAYLYPSASGRLETAYAEARPGGDSVGAVNACMTGKPAAREASAETPPRTRKPALIVKPD